MKTENMKKNNVKSLMIKCINKDRFDLISILQEVISTIGTESIGEQSQYGSIKTLLSNVEYVISEVA